MTAILTATLTLLVSGNAMYARPEAAQQRVEQQRIWGHVTECRDCIGTIALQDCTLLDDRAYVYWYGTDALRGPYWVTDCAEQGERTQTYLAEVQFAGEVEQNEWYTYADVGERNGAWVDVYLMESDSVTFAGLIEPY